MTKGVRVEYHSFDMDGTETVYERTVYSVRIMSIPVSTGVDDFFGFVYGSENAGFVWPGEPGAYRSAQRI